MTPLQCDVFLSHHSGDKPWVIALKSALVARGVTVWLDRDEIRPGDHFVDALEQGIESSRNVALVVSPESMRSAWVKEEYARALALATSRQNFRIIPCLLRNATLPGFLASRNWVDFREPQEFERKVEELCFGITGRKTTVAQDRQISDSGAPVVVSAAELSFLDTSIANTERECRSVAVLRWVAPTSGLAASALWPPDIMPVVVQYLGGAAFVGLLGFALTQKKWARLRLELQRLRAHRQALAMCRTSPGPVCPDVVDAFNRYIRRVIGIEQPAGDGARS
jgi:hypothetical protein